MRKFLAAAAIAAVSAAVAVPASAAVMVGVAPPGGTIAGFATPQIVVPQGQSLTFINFDIDSHDIASAAKKNNGDYKFKSDVIEQGETADVDGVSSLDAGEYEFICSIHGNMTGVLTIV